MALENKKQLLIIVGAVAAGLVAVVVMSNYVKTTVQNQTQALSEQYEAKQRDMMGQMQQQSEQKMQALANAIERVKAQEAEERRKQMAALQAAQQAAAAAQARNVQEKPKPVRKPSLALKTPVGKRAVTVKIDSLAAVGGLINAGDIVDIIAHLNVPSQDSDKKTVTAMVFQGLQILAVNTNEDDPGAYDEQQSQTSLKVTLAVDPQEAGLLSFADKNGTLQLALRSPDDSEHQAVKASTWKTLADYVLKNEGPDLMNPDGTPEEKPQQEEKPNIQIFRGGKEL